MSTEKARSPGKGDRAGDNDSPRGIDRPTSKTFEGFRMVPDRLHLDHRLAHVDVRTWCILAFTARGRDHTEATDGALAAMMGISQQSVRRSLLRLEGCRFIDRKREGEGRVIRLHPGGDGATVPGLEFRVIG